jgi:hypothetical protein
MSGRRPITPDLSMVAAIFRAAELQCGHRACAWCGRFLGIAQDIDLGQVSHGMCSPICEPARAMGWSDGDFSRDGGDNASPSPGVGGPVPPASRPAESAPAPASFSVIGHGAAVGGAGFSRFSPASPATFFSEVSR